MLLIHLPYELQLLILNHVKRENHLDLAPLAQTCSYYFTMVADRFNWNNTVTILQTTIMHSLSLNYLVNAIKTSKKKTLITKKLQVMNNESSTISLILNILEKQFDNIIQDIQLMIPSNNHYKIYQTLINFPQTELIQFTIRDPTDDGYIIIKKKYQLLLQQFLSSTLSKSQLTLNQLDISSFPSNLLISQYKKYQFPLVKSLKIALVGGGGYNQEEQQEYASVYWRQFKFIFPNLHELTLTLTKQHVSIFKFLLQDVSLFPWIKRLSISSRETPKDYLTREELRSSLLQLNGLNRITAGWDMIALN